MILRICINSDNESQILLYEAARKQLKELSNGEKLSSMKALKTEKDQLTQKKNTLYEDYSLARAKYRELQTVESNVQAILAAPVQAQNRASER